MSRVARSRRASSRAARKAWSRLSDDELLKLRFCDLGLTVRGSRIERSVRRLYAELQAHGIRCQPHVWLAEEWFTPDGVPGIAVPFYLAHPRLTRLERRLMAQAEGGNSQSFMRILRHEAGHAIDNAYRLRRRKCWREVFGPASQRYPLRYTARPASRRYVHHLGDWYAQAHPAEDFAETFAVWLTPRSAWRTRYADWPALRKLLLVDRLMAEVRGRAPSVRTRTRIEPIETNRRTLGEHYRRKLAHYAQYRRSTLDVLLQWLFSAERPRRDALRVATLLRANQRALIDRVSRELGLTRYSVREIARTMIDRSEALQLYIRGDRRDAVHVARWLLQRVASLYSQGETPHMPL
jgi:hypothetical protein